MLLSESEKKNSLRLSDKRKNLKHEMNNRVKENKSPINLILLCAYKLLLYCVYVVSCNLTRVAFKFDVAGVALLSSARVDRRLPICILSLFSSSFIY